MGKLKAASAMLLAALIGSSSAYAQELRIVIPHDLRELEPCQLASSTVSPVIQHNVVESLVNIDPATGALVPRLATEWTQVDDETVRFKLRENVKFHDGSIFDAKSVEHTFVRLFTPAIDCITAQRFFNGLTVSTHIVDDHTIDIKATPAQPLLSMLMAHVAMVPTNTTLESRINVAIGTGPYTLETTPGQQAVLTRFDDYWGEAPVANPVTYISRSDRSVAAAMVAAGEAELAPYIARADAVNAETDVSYPTSDTLYLHFTMNTDPLTDVRVREAINYAIDREAFIGTVLGDGVIPASQMVLPFLTGYNDDLKPWAYDVEKARALLAEAKADGVPVDKEIVVYATGYLLEGVTDLANVISQMLNDAGLKTQIKIVERQEWVELVLPPHLGPDERQAGIFINTHDNATGDAGTTLYFKYSSKAGRSELVDAELDALIDLGMSLRGEERDATFAKAFARNYYDIIGDAMLFHLVGYARVSPTINWAPTSLTHTQLPVEDITFK